MLSEYEADPRVGSIHVFGMNWQGNAKVHIDFKDPTLVARCCTKCTIHPTADPDSYGVDEKEKMLSGKRADGRAPGPVGGPAPYGSPHAAPHRGPGGDG